jgi:DUF917 family protein
MNRKITINDINNLAKGAAFLGSGGGGDPHYEIAMAKNQLMQYGDADLISVDQLNDDDLILPMAFVGAPLVTKEKLPSGIEITKILEIFERHYGKKPAAIMSGEIGGGNALTPLLAASKEKIKIIDGDLLGRAFPELQMASPNIFKARLREFFTCDSLGNSTIIEGKTAQDIERIARSIAVACGSSMMMGMYIMNGKEAKEYIIRNSVSKAIEIGRILNSTEKPLCDLIDKTDGKYIATGNIIDIDQQIINGFLNGFILIKSGNNIYKIDYQNEYLAIYRNNELIISTPDIIAILDQVTMKPITSESLIFGLRVIIVSIRADDIWYSEEGLKLVGPKAFNIEEKQ